MFKLRIKNRFFWSSYNAIAYWTETSIKDGKDVEIPITPRLVIQIEKNKIVVIPDIIFRTWELETPEEQEGNKDGLSSGRKLPTDNRQAE